MPPIGDSKSPRRHGTNANDISTEDKEIKEEPTIKFLFIFDLKILVGIEKFLKYFEKIPIDRKNLNY